MMGDETTEATEITGVVLDYFEGWFAGDPVRMERALHPSLAKRALLEDGRTLDETTASEMVEATRQGIGRRRHPGDVDIQVTVEDVHGPIASVTVRSTVYREYVQLVRVPEGWKIIHTLYGPS